MDSLPWFHIQRATPGNLAEIAEMTAANIAEEQASWPTGDAPPAPADARRIVEDALFGPSPAARAFVAVAAERAIGVAYVCDLFPGGRLRRGWFLKQLYVTPAQRGRGVGTALPMHARHAAEESGADRLELHTHPNNQGAQRLYERLGMNAPPRRVYRFDF